MHFATLIGKSHSYNAMLQVNCKAQQMVPNIVHARLTPAWKPCSYGAVNVSSVDICVYSSSKCQIVKKSVVSFRFLMP